MNTSLTKLKRPLAILLLLAAIMTVSSCGRLQGYTSAKEARIVIFMDGHSKVSHLVCAMVAQYSQQQWGVKTIVKDLADFEVRTDSKGPHSSDFDLVIFEGWYPDKLESLPEHSYEVALFPGKNVPNIPNVGFVINTMRPSPAKSYQSRAEIMLARQRAMIKELTEKLASPELLFLSHDAAPGYMDQLARQLLIDIGLLEN